MPDPTRKTLSATEIPALFDASPYLTRWMLYKKFADGENIETEADGRMTWGNKMQPLLLAQAAEDLRFEVHPNETYVSNGLIGCTRDAEIICPDRGPGALECKCCFDYTVWMRDWGGGKSPPKHNEIQLQVQMKVGDGKSPYQWGVLSCWVGGEQRYFQREPLPELWAEIDKEAARFFDDVANKREPNPFGAPVEMLLLNRLYPVRAGQSVDFTVHPRAADLAEQVRLMTYHAGERGGHEKAEKAIKAMLKAMMGEAEEATFLHGIKVRQKQQSRAGYTVKPTSFTVIEAFVPESTPAAEPPTKGSKMLLDISGG